MAKLTRLDLAQIDTIGDTHIASKAVGQMTKLARVVSTGDQDNRMMTVLGEIVRQVRLSARRESERKTRIAITALLEVSIDAAKKGETQAGIDSKGEQQIAYASLAVALDTLRRKINALPLPGDDLPTGMERVAPQGNG